MALPGSTAHRSRLSVDAWAEAGLEILAEDGIGGVKINRLCARLGVTKGSFYWHFSDLDEYLGAIAERWGEGRDDTRRRLHALRQEAPIDRLRGAMAVFLDEHIAELDQAMREWSRNDDRARDAVAASDRFLFKYLLDAFRELGFDAAEADLRAKVLYYSGVGYSQVGPLGRTRGSGPDEVLRLLVLDDSVAARSQA